MRIQLALRFVLATFCLAAPAVADTVTGQVVDENGVGIPLADLDAFDITNDVEMVLTGDSTDAAGFFSTTIPSGRYRLTVEGPVGSNHMSVVFPDVDVLGTLDLGVVTLIEGVHLDGRVLDQNGFPVFGVDLDIIDSTTGLDVNVSGDRTDIFGTFNILVPRNIELRFDTRNVFGATLAPIAMNLALVGDTSLGDVVLEPGYVVSGIVTDSGGAPVPATDFDLSDPSGQEAFLLSDNTNQLGAFSFVVAAGTWDIKVCPPGASSLAGAEMEDQVIAADTVLAPIILQPGFALSGTVTDWLSSPVQGVDVDVSDAVTGAGLALCNDRTDPLGQYSLLVPAGTWDVRFTTPPGLAIEAGVVIAGPTQVDASLSPCPPASAVVQNGTGVNPLAFTSVALPRIGKTWRVTVDCSSHAPSAVAVLLFDGGQSGVNTLYGQFFGSGNQLFLLGKPHFSNVVPFSFDLPPNLAFCGRVGSCQALILGSPGPRFTNALELTVGS